MDWAAFLDILKEAVVITLVVTALMLAIETLNYFLKGKFSSLMKRGRVGQIAASSALGAVPGCAGGYFSVSMYSTGMFSYGALLAMMVSTTGDEAFLMLALFPKTALIIFVSLFVLGIVVGRAYDAVSIRKRGSAAYLVKTSAGEDYRSLGKTLLHVLPHALQIFAWSFGIMLVVAFAGRYVDVPSWIRSHQAVGILAAMILGLVPQSGPHMAFVKLFADGVVPLPVLIASCIVQDGHAGLPLLSCDKGAFFRGKLIKLVLAALIAGGMTLAGL